MATRKETWAVVPIGDRPEVPFIGGSSTVISARSSIIALAGIPEPVVIEGPTGTGKEVVARRLHAQSARPGAYVGLNCAALPAHTSDSELFGHERGAFTGAVALRRGCFEQAHGGDLVLDELQDLPFEVQAKLLRVLESGSVIRLGGDRSIVLDVRLVVCTQRPLRQLVRDGRLREDLYYRLNVHTIRLAPLQERPGDIPLLLEHFSGCTDPPAARVRSFSPGGPGSPRALRLARQRTRAREGGPAPLRRLQRRPGGVRPPVARHPGGAVAGAA